MRCRYRRRRQAAIAAGDSKRCSAINRHPRRVKIQERTVLVEQDAADGQFHASSSIRPDQAGCINLQVPTR